MEAVEDLAMSEAQILIFGLAKINLPRHPAQ